MVGSKDERAVSGNQLPDCNQASRHLTEIFLGETMVKSGASYDKGNWTGGEKKHIGWLRRRGAPRETVDVYWISRPA